VGEQAISSNQEFLKLRLFFQVVFLSSAAYDLSAPTGFREQPRSGGFQTADQNRVLWKAALLDF
jgi:hypothetical protein